MQQFIQLSGMFIFTLNISDAQSAAAASSRQRHCSQYIKGGSCDALQLEAAQCRISRSGLFLGANLYYACTETAIFGLLMRLLILPFDSATPIFYILTNNGHLPAFVAIFSLHLRGNCYF